MSRARRLRVLHVVGGLGLGGGEKLTALVAAGLDRERFEVTVLNLGHPGAYEERLRRESINVIDLGLPLRPGVSAFPTITRGLIQLLRILFARPRWDIVHTHMFRTSLLCAVPARLAGSRLFGTVHRIYYRWQPRVERLLAPLHEAIVVDSAAVGQILRAETRIPADRYVVIHNGIDTRELDAAPTRDVARRALGLPLDATVVTEVAHLEPHKGQKHLVAAFARASGADDRLLLVGDGSTRPQLEGQAAGAGLADRVLFTGARQDLPVILSASDIVALPSTFEGFGIVQAEAMYLRIPVVGTDRGGATEVILDGVTGYLVPFADERLLAERLAELLRSPELRSRMGAAGRARVLEQFTLEQMARRYAELYNGTLRRELAAATDGP